MAKLTGAFKFIGSLDGINAYKNPNSDDIILRRKGGPTKNQINNSPQFENTRRINKEFGGCSTASKFIRCGLKPHKPLMHKKLHSILTSHIKALLKLDRQNEWGKRSIIFSKNTHLFKDYHLNPEYPLDSIVLKPITYTLSRYTLNATIAIPSLQPGKDLMISGPHTHYRFMASLAIVPNLYLKGDKYYPSHKEYERMFPETAQSQWFLVNKESSETQLEITFPVKPVDDAFSLMLSIGVYFGAADQTGHIQQVEKEGCSKILALA